MAIVKIIDQGGRFAAQAVTSLRQAVNERGSHTFLLAKVPTSGYLYPGSYGNIDKVVVSVPNEDTVVLDIVTAVDPLLKVLDPKRVTAEAIEYLKTHHEEEVKRTFLHHVFHENQMVLPKSELMIVRTVDNRDYALNGGGVWEITANDLLVPVYNIPDKPVTDVIIGDRASDTSTYTFVTHAVYAEDISFG
jgi:hypothetical protein